MVSEGRQKKGRNKTSDNDTSDRQLSHDSQSTLLLVKKIKRTS